MRKEQSIIEPPDLTIVLESTTGEITGGCDGRRSLAEWCREAASIVPRRAEVILVAPDPVSSLEPLPEGVRVLQVPGAGYYALKNAGANEARGRIVLFSDIDCRPGAGYARALLDAFADERVGGVAGRSLYDGEGLLTRINTVNSFGDLHRERGPAEDVIPLAHNVAVRRALYDRDPWGPFVGRVGGDAFLARRIRESGHRLALDVRLLVRHEDPSYQIRGLVERHLRDTFVPLHYGTEGQRLSVPFVLACALLLRPALRLKRVLLAGRKLGLRPVDAPVVLGVELAYWAFDLVMTVVVLAWPPLRRRWRAFLAPDVCQPAAQAAPGLA